MRKFKAPSICCVFVLGLLLCGLANARTLPESAKSESVLRKQIPLMRQALSEKGLSLGSEIFIRIFKKPAVLELWVKSNSGKFSLFNSYRVCNYSGGLGPKREVGDRQSPEGFYYVTPKQLNPWSRFHLSFNLGYPNRYDRYHRRTGSALMVHGNCVSVGCYAMTDDKIEEIYTLMHSSLDNGQAFVRVHIFPFPLNDGALEDYKNNPSYEFWKNLKTGYDWFEENAVPPNVEVDAGEYTFN